MIGVFGAATDEREVEATAPSIIDGWMGLGPRVSEFEDALAEHLGGPVVMVDSGSNALHVAVALLDLPPRSEVVLPAFTWVSCAHAVVLAGHVPVFADVDPETQNLDAASVEQVVGERTAAIMLVHYAGKPADVEALRSLGLPLIEDAAHAIDSRLDGKACGMLGDVGIYSFDSVKNLATPDGGAVAAQDPDRLERARQLRYCGIGSSGFARSRSGHRWWEHEINAVFPRALPNDVSASIGLVQLEKLPQNQSRRAQIWAWYQRELADVQWLRLPVDPGPRERHSYFTYLVRVLDDRRDQLAERLLESGIYTTLRYHPLHLSPVFGHEGSLPVSEHLAAHGLNLPLHPRMSDQDVEAVVGAVKGFR